MEEKRIDEGWKKKVQEEKAKASSGPTIPKAGDSTRSSADFLPAEITFTNFVSGLATQTLIALGQVPHPTRGEKEVNLEEARYLIDTIQMLETKTRGNLTPAEAKAVKEILSNLQMAYVALSRKPG